MVQGTTPKHTFILPFSSDAIRILEIVYQQNGQEVLRKTESDCILKENEVSLKLTQEETFLFNAAVVVDIQIRVKTFDGEVLASRIAQVSVDRCLSSEVL